MSEENLLQKMISNMKLKILLTIFIFVIFNNSGSSQIIQSQDLLGSWEINSIKTIHKDFRVVLTFESNSVFREEVNDKQIAYERFKIKSDSLHSYLVFISNGPDKTNEMLHPITLHGDSLRLGNYYFPYKKEYNLPENDYFFFIRKKSF